MLNLSLCLGGENLGEFGQRGSLIALSVEMLGQTQLGLLLIQPLAAGVGGGFADGMGEGAGEDFSTGSRYA